jgi:hypothetical protein
MTKITFFGMSTLIALSMTLQGCTDTEQAAAAGGIIGAAIGIAASGGGSSHDHHHRPPPRQCHGGQRQSCTTYTNYRGYTSTQCNYVYDHCASYYEMAFEGKPDAALFVTEENAQIAQNWALSFDSAATISSAVKALNMGDISAAAKVGLSSADLADLAQGRALRAAAVDSVAISLDIPASQAQQMINVVTEGAKAKLSQSQYDRN